jgi:hypothetical protein
MRLLEEVNVHFLLFPDELFDVTKFNILSKYDQLTADTRMLLQMNK